jgi:hypothetical protein
MKPTDAYKYLYFRIYIWQLHAWGASHQPELNAMLIMTILVYLNVIGMFFCLDGALNIGFLRAMNFGKIHALALGIIIGGINYLVFIYNHKYRDFTRLFGTETQTTARERLVWCWCYVLFVHLLFFSSLLVMSLNRN